MGKVTKAARDEIIIAPTVCDRNEYIAVSMLEVSDMDCSSRVAEAVLF